MSEEIKVYDRRIPEPEPTLPARQGSPNAVIMMAMQKGYDVTLIEKMMALQERYEANEARKAYVRAMAAFKANPPEILKTKHVSYVNNKNQTVEWDHAVLGEIAEAIIKGMSPHGLYHRWDMTQPDVNTVKTTCIITHELGHSESTTMSGPPDTSGGKDNLKAVASTNTLLQRLTLLALTGLAAKGMDNEGGGNGGTGEPSKFEQWEIKAREVCEAARTLEDLITWWPDNGPTIKKELSKADAAKIYNMWVDRKNELKKAERQPGEEG
jgi:hypothetical protein